MAPHLTPTALGRWSSVDKQLPAVEKIRVLHVYDFDNTLFKTPTPNPHLWHTATYGRLMSPKLFQKGGWWHDNRILAATGQGVEIEEPRAWEGWWNEEIVKLVELSAKQPDALSILLTGRSEADFSEIVNKIVASKNLDFDLVCLKPKVSPTNQHFQSTMHFKQIFLDALMETYKCATEIKIYEDRPKHTHGFRTFFAEYNRRLLSRGTRKPLAAEAIQVTEDQSALDPVIEVAVVHKMMREHNKNLLHGSPNRRALAMKKCVYYTCYKVKSEDTSRMRGFLQIPSDADRDLGNHADSILISPRACPPGIMAKVGGVGSKMTWEVTGVGHLNTSLWAARVRPVPDMAEYHTDNPYPIVILAMGRGARPADACRISDWKPLPPDQAVVFETVVTEKASLMIASEGSEGEDWDSLPPRAPKRARDGNDDVPRNMPSHLRGGHFGGRGRGVGGAGGRGMRANLRGSARGGRGRGGFHSYRSLDDVEPRGTQSGQALDADPGDVVQLVGPLPGPPTGPRALQGRGGASQHGQGLRRGSSGRASGVVAATTGHMDLQDLY